MRTYDLPMPPSVNSLYRNVAGKGRVRTGFYKGWVRDAGMTLMIQRPATIDGDVTVDLVFGPRDKRRDLDNLAKGTLDILVKARVIKDDSNVIGLTMAWSEQVYGCKATVKAATYETRSAA